MRCRLSLLLVATALALVAFSGSAAGARRGSEPCSSPALTGPTVAHIGEPYTVTGCGFEPGSLVPLNVTEADGCCMALNMVADEYGRFSYMDDVWAPGTYGVRAWVPRNGSGRWRLAAEWWFDAYL